MQGISPKDIDLEQSSQKISYFVLAITQFLPQA